MATPKTCAHTMLDGHRCGCMALTGKPYCHYHARQYHHNARPTDPDYDIPIFEDSRSILLAIRETIDAYMHGKLDQKQTTTMLYAYQIAMSSVHRPDGMSPHGLKQLELRLAAQALAKSRARSRIAEDEQAHGPSLTEFLADRLREQTDGSDELSEPKSFIELLESRLIDEPTDPEKP